MDLRGMFHTSLLVLVPVFLGKLLCLQQPSEQAKGKQHQQALILLLGIRFQGAVPFESPILFRWEMMNSCLKTAAAESATTTISISTSQSAKKRSRIFQVTHEHKHILFLFPSSIKHHSLLFSTSVKKESIAISLNCSLPCSWWHLSVSSLSASF